jgi:serine/threonine protein kinase
MDLEYAILHHPLTFDSEVWSSKSPQLIELITRMLQRNELERITASDILKHPWFTNQ